MSFVLLAIALLVAPLAFAAARRPSGGHPLWLPAMVGAELAPWFLAALALAVAGFVAAGWSGGWAGGTAVAVAGCSAAGFGVAIARSRRVGDAVAASVSDFLGEPMTPPRLRVRSLVPAASPESGLVVSGGLRYGPHPRHLVDRIALPGAAAPAPAIVHVHGGGWWRGRRHRQALPLLHRMARAGWVAFTTTYRLSPEATFPDHLVDVKRVVAWIREHAADLGVDGSFVVVAGGSAGGQLAALAALTIGDRSLQPGFEEADASVQACVPFYGVHDLLDGRGEPLWPYLVPSVMKADPGDEPEAWRRASPIRTATADRPPFFVVHGAADTLVDPDLSGRLVAALRAEGGPRVGHLEVPGGNHGFDYFRSVRSCHVVEGVATVLEALRRRAAGGAV
ncbi:MAG: alpha/beta hydrolase [Actinomycetota bacterium]